MLDQTEKFEYLVLDLVKIRLQVDHRDAPESVYSEIPLMLGASLLVPTLVAVIWVSQAWDTGQECMDEKGGKNHRHRLSQSLVWLGEVGLHSCLILNEAYFSL